MDLELATAQDMVSELDGRKAGAVLVVAPRCFESDLAVGPEDRWRHVYADSVNSQHPAFKAAFLCDGIQQCLDEASKLGSNGAMVVHLSTRLSAFKAELEGLMPPELRR